MSGAESIVNKYISKTSELCREGFAVFGFFCTVTGIFEENNITVEAPFDAYGQVQKFLEDNGFEIISGEFVRIPTDTKEVTAEQRESLEKLIEKLEEDDDVTNVYTTMAEE